MSHSIKQLRSACDGPDVRPRETWTHGAGGHDWQVYLDGCPLPLCTEANTAGGWARVYRVDAAGEIRRDWSGQPEFELLFGNVEVRPCTRSRC